MGVIAAFFEFLQVCFSTWMIPLTVVMILTVLYWLVVITGVLGMELLDGLFGGLLDGATEGAAEGATEGALEAAGGFLGGLLMGICNWLSLGRVPATLVLSIIIFLMWIQGFIVKAVIEPMIGPDLGLLVMLAVALTTFAGSAVAAIAVTGLIVRPLRKQFHHTTEHAGATLVGKTCRIKSTQVSDSWGQGEVELNRAPVILKVVCDEENNLTRGSEALIVIGINQ